MNKAAMTWLALRSPNARRVWASVAVVLFLALQIFASSSVLHHALHADASAPDHHCAIASVAQGQVDVPIVPSVFIAFVGALIFFLPPVQAAIFSSFDYRLAPSRAPPRS